MTLTKSSHNWFPSVPSIFDRFFDGDLMDWNKSNYSASNATLPSVNVRENDDAYLIDLAAPGLTKEDFKVDYDNGQLIIASEKQTETSEENEEKKEQVLRWEFNYQNFRRTFRVAEHLIDADKISASYEQGILHIVLPKREEVKPKPKQQILIA